jgi:tetratricopeptide (TPR) repeat protein
MPRHDIDGRRWRRLPRLAAAAAGLVVFGWAGSATIQVEAQPSPRTVTHPIQTTSAEAQREFDRGLDLVYAFDYDQAIQAFERAARLDPHAAMPHWGIALALGPNLNDLRMPGRMQAAFDAAQRALQRSKAGPPRERDYASALAQRYAVTGRVNLRQLYGAYAAAMRTVAAAYPDDVDASVLFAESLMLSGRGGLWLPSGEPGEGIREAIQVMDAALARAPAHLGANHYYIHLYDTSPTPEKALTAAERLDARGNVNGHLAHMPSHIFVRMGDYRRAVRSNLKAVAADRGHAEHKGPVAGYHDLREHSREFLSATACLTGQSALARRTLTNMFVLLRFKQWSEVLRLPAPDHPVARLEWSIGRVLALIGSGKVDEADAARAQVEAAAGALPADALWWSDPIAAFLPLARDEMAARLNDARGNRDVAITLWRRAAQTQDRLTPGEVPMWPWFHSVRESLGAALHRAGRFDEAERVFREDLARYPANPRSLYGLWQTLLKRGRPEAAEAGRRFRDAWADADVPLTIDDL